MEKNIETLLKILLKEKAMYQKMLALEEQKLQLLKAANLQGIQKNQLAEDELQTAISSFGIKRQKFVADLAKLFKRDENLFTLSELIAKVGPDDALAIQSVQADFAKLLGRLANVRDLNEKLITAHLEYVQFMLNVMSQEDQVNNTYGLNGETQVEDERRINMFNLQA